MKTSEKTIQVRHRSEKDDDRKDDDHSSDNLVDEPDAVGIELTPDFVHEPCQSEPP